MRSGGFFLYFKTGSFYSHVTAESKLKLINCKKILEYLFEYLLILGFFFKSDQNVCAFLNHYIGLKFILFVFQYVHLLILYPYM